LIAQLDAIVDGLDGLLLVALRPGEGMLLEECLTSAAFCASQSSAPIEEYSHSARPPPVFFMRSSKLDRMKFQVASWLLDYAAGDHDVKVLTAHGRRQDGI